MCDWIALMLLCFLHIYHTSLSEGFGLDIVQKQWKSVGCGKSFWVFIGGEADFVFCANLCGLTLFISCRETSCIAERW